MFSGFQIIALLVFYVIWTFIGQFMILLPYGTNVLLGWITGIIMGDPTMGLMIGGTMELMSIGMNPLGGSVVPDYAVGTFVGVAFAVATGQGMDVGIGIGIPVATLCVELTVLIRTAMSFFLHKAMGANEAQNFKGMRGWIWSGLFATIVLSVLPVAIVLVAGSTVIEWLLAALPAWLMNGFSVAGGILPAIGFAVLLNCLPLKNNFMWLILGYVLYAYLNLPVLSVALLALVIAWLTYINNEQAQRAMAVGGNGGINDDE